MTDQSNPPYNPGNRCTVTFWNPAFHQLGVEWDNGSHLMTVLGPRRADTAQWAGSRRGAI